MTQILAIDPGNKVSAFVLWDSHSWTIRAKGKHKNEDLIHDLRTPKDPGCFIAVIEQIQCYGMAVGAEVFETVFWSGRFAEAIERHQIPVHRIGRGPVKLHLCRSSRARDANVRQALIDRFGGSEAIGKKKTPGPLYGVAGDIWAALAVAVVWSDLHPGEL